MDQKLDVLAIGAHPDDIELMCAATMIKMAKQGYKTGIVSLTSGEMGSRGTPEQRREEAKKAADILGVKEHRILDIPDGSVQITNENKIKVIQQIRAFQPRVVFAPYWNTRHPDHGNCSHLVREAAYFAGLKQIQTGQEHFRPAKVIYYMELYDFDPSFIVDVSDTFEKKIKAMQAYESQFYTPGKENNKGETETFISTPEFLQSIIIRGQYWGTKIGVKYGEPFLIREPLRINDPVHLFGEPDPTRMP